MSRRNVSFGTKWRDKKRAIFCLLVSHRRGNISGFLNLAKFLYQLLRRVLFYNLLEFCDRGFYEFPNFRTLKLGNFLMLNFSSFRSLRYRNFGTVRHRIVGFLEFWNFRISKLWYSGIFPPSWQIFKLYTRIRKSIANQVQNIYIFFFFFL